MFPIYLSFCVLLLLTADYLFCRAYMFGSDTQEQLDSIFDPVMKAGNNDEPRNVFFLTNDVPVLLGRIFVALAWIIAVSLCLPAADLSGVGLLLVLLSLYIVVCVVAAVNVYCVHLHKNSHTRSCAPLFVNRLFCCFYVFLRKFIARNMASFRIEGNKLGLDNKKPKYKKENLLKGILQFRNETVKDIMTSRLDIVDIDIRTSFQEVLRLVSEDSYSRVPVYSGTKDNIVGVLYIKDLLPYLGKSDKFRWSFLIRPQLSVPETKKIDNLLREFQSKKVHIAVVIDEYGGVSGIVTLEDIIEEIVGEINDEYDDDRRPYVALSDNAFVFDAKTSLQDFCKLFDIDSTFFDDAEGDADTIAGLLLDLFGDFPNKHQTIRFKQFEFEVLEVDERHISKVKVTVEDTKPLADDEAGSE